MNRTSKRITAESLANEAVMAFSAIRSHAELLSEASTQIATYLDNLSHALSVLRQTDDSDDLLKLHNRVLRLYELRNQMELGGFLIQVRHVLDAAFQRLP